MEEDSESYATQIKDLLSAVVGIMTYLVRGHRVLPEGAVTSAKRKRDMAECQVSAEHPENRNAAQRPDVPEAACRETNCGSHATEEASRQPEQALAETMPI